MNFWWGMVPWALLLTMFFLHWAISTLWERRRQRRPGAGVAADHSPQAEASSKARAR